MIKILGSLDILMAVVILFLHWSLLPWNIVLFASLYLIGKGAVFYTDWLSYIDIFIGLFLWIIFFGAASWFDFVLALVLLYKGVIALA